MYWFNFCLVSCSEGKYSRIRHPKYYLNLNNDVSNVVVFSCQMGSESKQGHGPFQLSIQIFLQGTECVILNNLKNSKNAPKKQNYICVAVEHPSGESI